MLTGGCRLLVLWKDALGRERGADCRESGPVRGLAILKTL